MVRQELERAVAAGTPIIPVLVGGATVPRPDALPPALSRLPQLQMVRLADDSWEYDFARLLEALDLHGVVARVNAAGRKTSETPQGATDATVYQRTVRATRRRAYEAVVSTAEALGASIVSENPSAASMTVKLKIRTVTAKVVDEGAGRATVRLEMQTNKTKWLAATAVVTLPFYFAGAFGWAGLRLWEREWAKTFLENVERVIEGRGIDPAILARRNPVQQV